VIRDDESVTLLLVEDDEVDRLAFERFVRREGLPYRVTTASSLAEARRELAAGRFDVVLTDQGLGDGAGLDLVEAAAPVPVIVITGAGDEELAVAALRAGAYDYLIKDLERNYLKILAITVEGALRERRSELQRRTLEQAIRSINDAIYVVDLDGRFTFVNRAFHLAYGYEDAEILGQPAELLWAGAPQGVELGPARPAELPQGGRQGECRHRRHDGSVFEVLLSQAPILDGRGQVLAAVGTVRDISERRRAEERLAQAALHDALTGLPNRTLFLDRLDSALKRTRRKKEYTFGVVFLDLDRFKVVNDSLGHLAGDQLLTAIARRLEACLRLGDTVARLGGDEFAILLDDLSEPGTVELIAERIREQLEQPFEVGGQEVFTSASLGVALSSTGYERPEEMLRDADTAMFRAKAQGRTRWTVFDPSMHADAVALLKLETDLRRAVERWEFCLHYQPIVAMTSGELYGFEALVRWHHPERGLLAPDQFLPLVRETGLALQTGRWILREACRQIKEWRGHDGLGELVVNVNLDEPQLTSPRLPEEIAAILEEFDLEPEALVLELTEEAIVHHLDVTARVLDELKVLGVGLYVDDFGTGYSSLSQLHHFPIDALKIDRSFITRLGGAGEDLEIVRAIVDLGHNLGLEVLAEGIEKVEQWQRLEELGAELAQGFLIARPLTADDVEEHFATESEPFRVDTGKTVEQGN